MNYSYYNIRAYQPSDCKETAKLFYNTVHTINARDYTKEQLDAWTTNIDLDEWNLSLKENYSLVAIRDGIITAKPFFKKRGYKIIEEQQVERQGVTLINFVMEKLL